jgi:hypothetical protein
MAPPEPAKLAVAPTQRAVAKVEFHLGEQFLNTSP